MCAPRQAVLSAALVLAFPLAGCGDDPDDFHPDPDHIADDDDGGAGGSGPGDDDDGDDDDGDDDDDAGDDDSAGTGGEYPDFYTANEDYFATYIGSIPPLEEETYTLSITGLVYQPGELTLAELEALPQVEVPLTVECIGNPAGGEALSTAVWEGFVLIDLLESRGLVASATTVRYQAADGYYSSTTLDQVRDEGAIGALRMNGETLPANQGYPLRIIVPGTYGAKHPGWLTEIEITDDAGEDYWDDRGWDTSPPMDVDSKLFFPEQGSTVIAGEPFAVGGAAWGGGRIQRVEVTADGESWTEAEVVEQVDADDVWVFWAATLTVEEAGDVTLLVRATDESGTVQPQTDGAMGDGTNSWDDHPIHVEEPKAAGGGTGG